MFFGWDFFVGFFFSFFPEKNEGLFAVVGFFLLAF